MAEVGSVHETCPATLPESSESGCMGYPVHFNLLAWLKLAVLAALLLAASVSPAQTNPVPYIYPLYAAATPPGGAAFSLTVTGTGFVSGAVVNWNGSPRPTTFVSRSQVSAAIAAADIATARTAIITVTNPPPGGGTSNRQYFQVTFPYDALTFQDTVLAAVPNAVKVLVGDFNRDGKQDLVLLQLVSNPDGSFNQPIQILLGNGDGTFQPPMIVDNTPTRISITDLAAADLNGDGKLDLVGSYENLNFPPGGGGTFALLGNGDGTFQPVIESDNGFFSATSTVIADVNGDGIPDLLRSYGVVELGNGDGTFRTAFQYPPPFEFLTGKRVAIGDFHHNGKLDIIVGIRILAPPDTPLPSDYVLLLPGNGDGTFGTFTVLPTPDGFLGDFAVADFNHDGNLDLETFLSNFAGPPGGSMNLLLGNGDGTFQAPLTLPGLPATTLDENFTGLSPAEPTLVPGDFNGDGNIDLAFSNSLLLIGNATGPLNHDLITTPYTYTASAAADFNGDGRLDLVGIDSNQNAHVLLQTSVPDFQGSINDPALQTIHPGETGTYTVNVTSLNGFAGTIQFSATGLPPDATATFTPATLTGSGLVTVTVSTSKQTPKGDYLILLSGSSVGITHSGGVRLIVEHQAEQVGDFGGSVSPAFQSVVPGTSTSYQVSAFPLYGFDSDVHLEVSGLPPGSTASFNPSVIAQGFGTSVLTIATANPTPTGAYHLTITSHGGGVQHDDGMNLGVGPAGTDFTDFTGSITPSSQTVRVGGFTSFTAYIQPFDGSGCVFLNVLGLPAATNGQFDRTTGICGAPASTVFTITTSSQTPPGTYTLQFQGTSSGGFLHSQNVTLTVTP